MSLTELLPVVRSLGRPDKLRLLQFLAGELARDEGVPELQAGACYPIWSPYDAFEAAAVLAHALRRVGQISYQKKPADALGAPAGR